MPSTHPKAFMHQRKLAQFGNHDTVSQRTSRGWGFLQPCPTPRRGFLAKCGLCVQAAFFQPPGTEACDWWLTLHPA